MSDDWTKTTLGDIATLYMGRTPSRNSSEYWTTELKYPFCTIADMEGASISPSREGVTERAINDGKARVAPAGSLLMSFKLTIGRVGFAERDLYPNEAIVVINPDEKKAMRKFLYYQLGSMDLTGNSGRAVKGSTLNSSSLAGISISIPPLTVQQRIVDLMSSVDSYIAALQQQADAARSARSAVLSELLSAGREDWTETTIGDISDFVSLRVTPEKLNPLTPYVGLEHLVPQSAEISDWDTVENVSSSVTPFEPGDTLFGRLRPYLHKVAFAEFPGTCSPEILVLRSNTQCDSSFLYLLCALDSTIGKCVAMSAGTRMPRTSASDLASIEVHLPPITEQRRIVAVISSIDLAIQSTERAIADAKNLRSGLLSDLLSGEHEIPESYDRLLGAA